MKKPREGFRGAYPWSSTTSSSASDAARTKWRGRGARRAPPPPLTPAPLPLAHHARRGDVLAVLEADLADDGGEFVAGDVVAQRLAGQTHLLPRLLHYLQSGPRMRASPAGRVLIVLGDVRVEICLGRGAGFRIPRAPPHPALDRG